MFRWTPVETAVYAVLLITYYVIVWQWAKYGFWETGIQRPLNVKAFGSCFVGMTVLLIAGYIEREGYVDFSLFKEANIFKALLLIFGSSSLVFILGRYVILPKGLPEYNRARIRTTYWTNSYYRPGVKLETAENLKDFSMAQTALAFFQKSIEAQSKPRRAGSIVKDFSISQDEFNWYSSISKNCPNCGKLTKIPITARQGTGTCNLCDCGLAFKVMGNKLYLTAFGPKVRRAPSFQNKVNIATAYEEKALLLRMMNYFEEARAALFEASKIIDAFQENLKKDRRCLTLRSLILFREAEIAHALGEKTKAKDLYQKSLEIDLSIGNEKETGFVKRLISEVS